MRRSRGAACRWSTPRRPSRDMCRLVSAASRPLERPPCCCTRAWAHHGRGRARLSLAAHAWLQARCWPRGSPSPPAPRSWTTSRAAWPSTSSAPSTSPPATAAPTTPPRCTFWAAARACMVSGGHCVDGRRHTSFGAHSIAPTSYGVHSCSSLGECFWPLPAERAIAAVGSVIEHYDTTKRFPAFGFGAALPPSGTANHCFPLNGVPSSPEVEGIQGILEAYRQAGGAGGRAGPSLPDYALRALPSC